ncbi:MAG: tyrosine-protein phosphatase [Planctomycetota bacterium]
MTNVVAFYILQGVYIDGTLEEMTDEGGSLEAYLKRALGMTDPDVRMLRSQLLTWER